MAYESFTLPQLQEKFNLTLLQSSDDFGHLPPSEPSEWLRTTLAKQMPLIGGATSEKARSEFVIAPILVEVRDKRDGQIAVFSGIKFDVDKPNGLFGYCDFLLSREPLLQFVQAPVVAVVEAKKEDLNAGIPQCVAEMVAAQQFNQQRGEPISPIYGAVTDGTRWRFLSLEATTITIDLREWAVAELPQLLGILVHMVS